MSLKRQFPRKKGTWWLVESGERESHRKHQGEEGTVGETFLWWFLQEGVCKAGKAGFRLASWNDFSRL